jgi:hypothetical protein
MGTGPSVLGVRGLEAQGVHARAPGPHRAILTNCAIVVTGVLLASSSGSHPRVKLQSCHWKAGDLWGVPRQHSQN